jgi:hypothetical protein
VNAQQRDASLRTAASKDWFKYCPMHPLPHNPVGAHAGMLCCALANGCSRAIQARNGIGKPNLNIIAAHCRRIIFSPRWHHLDLCHCLCGCHAGAFGEYLSRTQALTIRMIVSSKELLMQFMQRWFYARNTSSVRASTGLNCERAHANCAICCHEIYRSKIYCLNSLPACYTVLPVAIPRADCSEHAIEGACGASIVVDPCESGALHNTLHENITTATASVLKTTLRLRLTTQLVNASFDVIPSPEGL